MSTVARHTLVLVVDDEPSIQRALTRLLDLQGFITMVADSVTAAIDVAERHRLDAVILDLTLQGADSGLVFLGWMRAQERYVNTPILILTGALALPEDAETVIRRHRAYVFYKPQHYSTLIEYVRRLTSESR